MRTTQLLTTLFVAVTSAVSAQVDTTTAETVSLSFGWPAGLSATVARSHMRVSTLGAFADTTGGSSRYQMVVSDHSEGTLVDFFDFEILELDDFQTDYETEMTLAKVTEGLVPSFIVGAGGEIVRVSDFPALRSTIDDLLGPDIQSLPDLPPGGTLLLDQMLSEAVFTAGLRDEWAASVEFWNGQDLKIGATYEYETPSRPPGTETALPFLTEFGVGSREPCAPGGADSSCVLLWRNTYPRPDILQTLSDNLGRVMRPDTLADFRVDSADISTSVVILADPDGLILHRVEIRRHTYTRTQLEANPPEETTQDRVVRLAYAYGDATQPVVADGLDAAIAVFLRNEVPRSIPMFRQVVEDDASNPDAHAWLADALRRTGERTEAENHARRALAIDACHSFAHTVVATLYNQQYRGVEAPSADSVWTHLMRAVDCDPDDGNAWLSLLFEAVHRGETQWEGSAARALVETGFLTDPTLAYQRAVLRSLPADALLLTGGDLDTYPALSLQIAEGLRPDVAVVNVSMLNLPWYAKVVRDRHGVTLPLDDAALEVFRPIPVADAAPITLADTIVRSWRNAAAAGALLRPLAIGITAGDTARFPGAGRMAAGGFYTLVHPSDGLPVVNPRFVRTALDSMGTDDLRGPAVSPSDRSPIRVALSTPPITLAGYAGLIYAAALEPDVLWSMTSEQHTEAANIAAGFEAIGHAWRPPFYDDLRADYAELWVSLSATTGDPIMAADYAGRAIRLTPNSGDARHLFGMALLRNHQTQDAVKSLFDAYSDPRPLANILGLADALRMSGDTEGSIAWSDSAPTLFVPQTLQDPDFVWGTWYVGLLPEIPDDAAIRQPVPVITTNEKIALAHHTRALDLALLGRRDAADAAFEQAVSVANTGSVQCIVQNRMTAALGHLDIDTDIRTWLIARRGSLDQVNCIMSG